MNFAMIAMDSLVVTFVRPLLDKSHSPTFKGILFKDSCTSCHFVLNLLHHTCHESNLLPTWFARKYIVTKAILTKLLRCAYWLHMMHIVYQLAMKLIKSPLIQNEFDIVQETKRLMKLLSSLSKFTIWEVLFTSWCLDAYIFSTLITIANNTM